MTLGAAIRHSALRAVAGGTERASRQKDIRRFPAVDRIMAGPAGHARVSGMIKLHWCQPPRHLNRRRDLGPPAAQFHFVTIGTAGETRPPGPADGADLHRRAGGGGTQQDLLFQIFAAAKLFAQAG